MGERKVETACVRKRESWKKYRKMIKSHGQIGAKV